MTQWSTFTVDGCARFPVLPPGAFPEAAGARLLTRCAAIRDGERTAVARAITALAGRALTGHDGAAAPSVVPVRVRDGVLAAAPTFVVSRNVVSDGGNDVALVVTMQVAVDMEKLKAQLGRAGTMPDTPQGGDHVA